MEVLLYLQMLYQMLDMAVSGEAAVKLQVSLISDLNQDTTLLITQVPTVLEHLLEYLLVTVGELPHPPGQREHPATPSHPIVRISVSKSGFSCRSALW